MQPARPIPRWLAPVLALLALVGFGDATYLSIEHFSGAIPPCTIHGCETVLTSAYSTIFGIPIALLGALYYFALLVIYLVYFEAHDARALNIALRLSVLGFLADLWFVSAQAFIIHAWCQYCLLSALMSTLIFIISYWYLISARMERRER